MLLVICTVVNRSVVMASRSFAFLATVKKPIPEQVTDLHMLKEVATRTIDVSPF